MKKFLLVGISFFAFSGAALAGDMSGKAGGYAPMFNWSGLYLGANGGYGWSDSAWTNETANAVFDAGLGAKASTKPTGALFGGQIGYNWQSGQSVFGLEFSGDGSWMEDSFDAQRIGRSDRKRINVSSLWAGTAKVGYAWDRSLIYFKGGYAAAQTTINAQSDGVIVGTPFTDRFSAAKFRSGWTIGAGWDHAITQNWIVGIEYDYYNFGTAHYTGITSGLDVLPQDFAIKSTVQSVLGRVSYKFGG